MTINTGLWAKAEGWNIFLLFMSHSFPLSTSYSEEEENLPT